MEATTYSNYRKSLKSFMKQVNEDSEPLIVTNKNIEEDIVVMGKDDYDSLVETMRIIENKYLYNKIRRGREQLDSKSNYHDLIEVDSDG